jgi:YbbR domain-containing protein
MQQRREAARRAFTNNLMWFAGSLALAFFVWVIATLDSDPIVERSFPNIAIRIEHDPGLIVTERRPATAVVQVRAPESTLEQLDQADIQVTADLRGLGPGEHRSDLEVSVSRRASVDTSPRRITVVMEMAQEKLVPVETVVTDALPRGYEIEGGSPVLEASQALVSGPSSQVEQVDAAQITLNLSQRRNPFSDELRLLPVDVDGNVVDDVVVEPATMLVQVPIRTRSDIRQVSVTPNILADTLPAGYALSSIEYEPQVILISGPPAALEDAPGTIFTEPIDLTGQTGNLSTTATLQLPNERLFIIGNQTVNVSIGITPLLSSRQFDRVPVEVIGLGEGYRAIVSPDEVTVLMTGPQILLDTLDTDDVRTVIDLNSLGDGNYQLQPDVIVSADPSTLTNLSVLPAELDVVIVPAETAAAEPTRSG